MMIFIMILSMTIHLIHGNLKVMDIVNKQSIGAEAWASAPQTIDQFLELLGSISVEELEQLLLVIE